MKKKIEAKRNTSHENTDVVMDNDGQTNSGNNKRNIKLDNVGNITDSPGSSSQVSIGDGTIQKIINQKINIYINNGKLSLTELVQIVRERLLADKTTKEIVEKMSDVEFNGIVEGCVNGKKGSLLMAESILSSCPKDEEYLSSVRDLAKTARNEFVVFLSAITKTKSGENTIEYKVARKLKEELNNRGIGVFWWEDEKIKSHNWNISTKIAMGLAYSSIFVGLAFDSVTKTKNDFYVYNCLLEGDEKYKEHNFFKYEVDTYWEFIKNNDIANEFVKGICKHDYLPKKRELRFFTYGKPEAYDKYPMFNNNEDRIKIIDSKLSVNKIVKNVLKEIIPLYKPDELNLIPKIWDKTEYKIYEEKIKELFHIAKNTPADYYLEYAIIDEKGNDASDHFLFFLEKVYNNSEPSMRLNMVVKDWNNAFCDYLGDSGNKALLKKAYGINTNEEFKINSANSLAFYNEFTITVLSQDKFIDEQKNENKNLEKATQDNGKSGSQTTTKWDYFALENSAKGYTNNGGKAEICGLAKSLRAKIEFSNKHKQFINERDSVSFELVINFAKKEVIKYTTHLSNKKLKICFDKPVSRDVEVDIVYSNNGVPCLTTAHRLNDDKITIERGSRFKSIKIVNEQVSNSTNLRICIPSVDGEETWEMKYPFIVFQYDGGLKSKSLNKRVFESGSNRNDGGLKSKSLNKRVFESGSNRTCIYCGNPVHKIKGSGIEENSKKNDRKRKMLFKKGNLGCNGNYKKNGGELIQSNIRKRFICFNNELLKWGKDFNKASGDNDTYFVLPDKYEKKHSTNAIVALIGACGAGKSTFISRFFNMKLGEDGKSFMLNKIVNNETDARDEEKKETYTIDVSSQINYGPVAMATNALVEIKEKDCEVTPESRSNEVKDFVNMYRSNYAISPYLEFIHATESRTSPGNDNLGKAIRYLPFITSVKKNTAKNPSYIALYDVSGEDLYNVEESGIKTVTEGNFAHQHANSIILFVNDGSYNASKSDISAATSVIKGYIDQYKIVRGKDVGDNNPITDVALAVVLCQFDRIESHFDINSNVRITAPAVKKHSYSKSELPEYIENCSQEVESYIKEIEGGTGLIAELNFFEHRKFFAVSSIGHNDSIAIKGDNKLTNFIAEPRNLEYVFLWLMYQMGVID